MKHYLISGARGLIGRHLKMALEAQGHRVTGLSRTPNGRGEVGWDPMKGEFDGGILEEVDGVVHLAGEGIAEERWTDSRKRLILESRVKSTRLLAEACARAKRSPTVFVGASGISCYPLNTPEVFEEDGPMGTHFLAQVVKEWEGATKPAADAGIRLVHARIGVVLTKEGGALAKMLPPFSKGLGGPAGSGKQHLCWIALPDMVNILQFALEKDALRGPVNCCAPETVSNADFATALGKALHKPAVIPAPAFALKLLFGQMADETILADLRVRPAVLQRAGFVWQYPELDTALKKALE